MRCEPLLDVDGDAGSVAQRRASGRGFPWIFIAASRPGQPPLVDSLAYSDERRAAMSRFTMALAAAAVAATAAIAVVALPAIGDDSNGADPGFDAFVACLRTHGLPGAPGDPAALKPWLLRKQVADAQSVEEAVNACQARPPRKPAVSAPGPDISAMIDCVRKHGFDAPTDPVAFKRWLATEESAHPDRLHAALVECKLALDPGPKKPQGDCGAAPAKPAPADKPAAPDDDPATTAEPEQST
jgi:hypothetical protein